jgi:subtilase family serine protease
MRIRLGIVVVCFVFVLMGIPGCSPSSTQIPLKPTSIALSTSTPAISTPTIPTPTISTPMTPASPGDYGPQELRGAYHTESLLQQGITGKGQTVVVTVSYGDPQLQQDFNSYCAYFGLPRLDLTVLAPLGPTPPASNDPFNKREHAGWAVETALDVEMIHAIAPEAKIDVLTTPVDSTEGTPGLPEFRQLIQYAVLHHLGSISSNSWGFSEASLQDAAGQAEIQQWAPLLRQATVNDGITFFFASGDHGASDYIDARYTQLSPTATTDFPADEPWVTGVGATALNFVDGQATEQTWTDIGKGASGGGLSTFFGEPASQQSLPSEVQAQLHGRRGIPDVAAVGDPATGVKIYANGHWIDHVGGTSVGIPIWAGIMALADQEAGKPLGFINPFLYKLGTSSTASQDFQDITIGNNTTRENGITVPGYPAVPGWDLVTGFGSPNGTQLISDLIAASEG